MFNLFLNERTIVIENKSTVACWKRAPTNLGGNKFNNYKFMKKSFAGGGLLCQKKAA